MIAGIRYITVRATARGTIRHGVMLLKLKIRRDLKESTVTEFV